MNRIIHIGFIGAGGIANERHLPGLKKVKGIDLAGVANRSPESSAKAAREWGFEKVYRQWQQLVDDPEIDAVFICSHPVTHKEMTLYALSKGKHVFCQARMAMDLKEAEEILEADRKTHLTTMLCFAPSYMKSEQMILEYVKLGKIGEVRHISLTHATRQFLDPSLPLHWRQRKDIQGINMLDVGIMAEVLQKWFGDISEIKASSAVWVQKRPADKEGKTQVERPDSVTILGRFASGIMLNALFTGAVAGGQPRLDIFGTKGSLTCYANEARFVFHSGETSTEIWVPEEKQTEWTVERDFIQAIRNGTKGYPSFEEGLKYMAFTQAVSDSMAIS